VSARPGVEELLRELAPQALGVLVRHYGGFDSCEDAVQEALLAAALQWPAEGVPANPKAWLITVASRRRTELWRNESARRRREETVAAMAAAAPGPEPARATDDTLTLLLLCCHPSLTLVSQVALTLRAVGGLTTAEIARGLLVPEATVAQRISRAKQRIRASGAEFALPSEGERSERMVAVRHVLYLIFNEGHTASSGPALQRVELTSEAIRLTRQLRELLPDDGEVAGLLALMLLTDARRAARTSPDGGLVPLAQQDRARWDARAIAEGIELITRTLATAPIGPYQLQAAIAAVHAEARSADHTDWREILGLYDLLNSIAPRRWSPSTASSPSPWSTVLKWVWSGSPPPSPIPRSPGTTASTRCGRTCSTWPASGRPRPPTTAWPPAARSASPSSATSSPGRRNSARRAGSAPQDRSARGPHHLWPGLVWRRYGATRRRRRSPSPASAYVWNNDKDTAYLYNRYGTLLDKRYRNNRYASSVYC
jgi:RNA polymerase sigma factor (sigma-70 family)